MWCISITAVLTASTATTQRRSPPLAGAAPQRCKAPTHNHPIIWGIAGLGVTCRRWKKIAWDETSACLGCYMDGATGLEMQGEHLLFCSDVPVLLWDAVHACHLHVTLQLREGQTEVQTLDGDQCAALMRSSHRVHLRNKHQDLC